MEPVQSVRYNSGVQPGLEEEGDQIRFALVTNVKDGNVIDLVWLDEQGYWHHEADVPRRAPQDYGTNEDGSTATGGRTWN